MICDPARIVYLYCMYHVALKNRSRPARAYTLRRTKTVTVCIYSVYMDSSGHLFLPTLPVPGSCRFNSNALDVGLGGIDVHGAAVATLFLECKGEEWHGQGGHGPKGDNSSAGAADWTCAVGCWFPAARCESARVLRGPQTVPPDEGVHEGIRTSGLA